MVPVYQWVLEPPLREKEWTGRNSSHMDDSGALKSFNLRPNQWVRCDSRSCERAGQVPSWCRDVSIHCSCQCLYGKRWFCSCFWASGAWIITQDIDYVWVAQVSRRLWVAKLSTPSALSSQQICHGNTSLEWHPATLWVWNTQLCPYV